ncbi:MAG: GFA family protein [Alphaproteobacteria bacterium]|nr:GFA family protein [Alphaproteobacteria bacterium]MDA8013294.1 GFA family protein [Alphaproteobacteria bacterium]
MTVAVQTGSCLCGAVSFRINAAPLRLAWCHCSMCRKFFGHAMASVNVDDTLIEWSAGAEARVAWFASSARGRRGSCRRCGSALFCRDEGDAHVSVAAGALDNPVAVFVKDHIYTADKGDWYELPDDGLPRHRGDRPQLKGENS